MTYAPEKLVHGLVVGLKAEISRRRFGVVVQHERLSEDPMWPVLLFANFVHIPSPDVLANLLAKNWHVYRKQGETVSQILLDEKPVLIQALEITLIMRAPHVSAILFHVQLLIAYI